MKNISWDKTFMDTAKLMAEHSTCKRLHVGAAIVKDKRVISCGYNGTPSGMEHCCDHFKDVDVNLTENREKHHEFAEKYEVHAEQNAICYAAKEGIEIEGCTIYTTTETCLNCAKAIVAAGIKRVVFGEKYNRTSEGTDFLIKAGVIVEQLKD